LIAEERKNELKEKKILSLAEYNELIGFEEEGNNMIQSNTQIESTHSEWICIAVQFVIVSLVIAVCYKIAANKMQKSLKKGDFVHSEVTAEKNTSCCYKL